MVGDHGITASYRPVWGDRLVIGLAYSLAWGALLVNRGLYWDDWTLVGRSSGDLVHGFTELGLPLGGFFYALLFSTPLPGLIGHVLVFCTYLAAALALHAILSRLPGLSRMDALIAALTFAVLPVNYARVAVIDAMYGLSLLAFLVATWLLIRFVEDGGVARRVGALLLYVLSFYTASLLVLYLVPIAIAAAYLRQSSSPSLRTFALRYADFLVLPVAYWLVKTAFLKPTGVYEGYNALSLAALAQVPRSMLSIPGQVLVEPLARAAAVAGIVGVIAGIGVAIWLLRRMRVVDEGPFVSAPVLALIGVVLIALGVFAYLAVGLVPTIWDWSSRHQLLVPLGAGLLAAAAARGIHRLGPPGRAGGIVVVGLLLGISVVADARTLIAYQVDWFKQQALIEAVRATPELQAARHIRIIDSATAYNALRRKYRFYEFNALFSEATGNTRRLASGKNEPSLDNIQLFISRPAYHMSEYTPSPVDLELRISTGEPPRALEVLRLVILEATGSPTFDAEVSRLIEVRAIPIPGVPSAP